MNSKIFFTLITSLLIFLYGAKTAKKEPHRIGAPILVYKTRGDYYKLVPVTLSPDRSRVVSYPAPQDVLTGGKLAYPTRLAKGYLLDNRGIGQNTAFLKITYEEYYKLIKAPEPDEMMKMIIDKDPVKELYNLGEQGTFKNEVEQIDSIIKNHALKNFKRIK